MAQLPQIKMSCEPNKDEETGKTISDNLCEDFVEDKSVSPVTTKDPRISPKKEPSSSNPIPEHESLSNQIPVKIKSRWLRKIRKHATKQQRRRKMALPEANHLLAVDLSVVSKQIREKLKNTEQDNDDSGEQRLQDAKVPEIKKSKTSDSLELPPCDVKNLQNIRNLIVDSLYLNTQKKLAVAFDSNDYISKLLKIFHACEKSKNMNCLYYLRDIFKNILLLDNNNLLEVMFSENVIFDVVGCFEYDSTPTQPKNYREYLQKQAKFKEVLSITNAELLAKIHQTHRVEYIQNVILTTHSFLFSDNGLFKNQLGRVVDSHPNKKYQKPLSQFISANKAEIAKLLMSENAVFLKKLFSELTDVSTPDDRRQDLALFLKEFCKLFEYMDYNCKYQFNVAIASYKIFPSLKIMLSMNDGLTKSASRDLLACIAREYLYSIWSYMTEEVKSSNQDSRLIDVIITEFLRDGDLEFGRLLRCLFEMRAIPGPGNIKQFLEYIYKNCMDQVVEPLLILTRKRQAIVDEKTMDLLLQILDLLLFCVLDSNHFDHMQSYIAERDFLKQIIVLVESTNGVLALAVLKFITNIVTFNDQYNAYIVKGNLFRPIFNRLNKDDGKQNIFYSTTLAMLTFIAKKRIPSLSLYIIDTFSTELEKPQMSQIKKIFEPLKKLAKESFERLCEILELDKEVPAAVNVQLPSTHPISNNESLSNSISEEAKDEHQKQMEQESHESAPQINNVAPKVTHIFINMNRQERRKTGFVSLKRDLVDSENHCMRWGRGILGADIRSSLQKLLSESDSF